MNDNIQRLLGKNIFLLYRGTVGHDGTYRTFTNSKYVGARIFYELSKHEDCDIFFAPGCYAENDNYQEHLREIFSTVKVAVIILSQGMLDRCFKDAARINSRDINYDDTLYKELRIVFEKLVSDDIKIFFIGTGDGYSFDSDREKANILFSDIWQKKSDSKEFEPFSKVPIKYDDNKSSVFDELYNSIHKELLRIEYNRLLKDSNSVISGESSRIVEKLLRCSSTTMIRYRLIEILKILFDNRPPKEYENFLSELENHDGKFVELLHECVKKWIEVIENKVRHFSTLKQMCQESFSTRKGDISIESAFRCADKSEALSVIKLIDEALKKRKEVFESYGAQYIVENDSLLTYSHSDYVVGFIRGNSVKSLLYICEARSKSLNLFGDADDVLHDVLDRINCTLITDASAYQLLYERKITKVVLGACSVTLRNGILTQIINTAGSETIIMAARKFGIPVYIISNTEKHIDDGDFLSRDQRLLTTEFAKKYPNKEISFRNYSDDMRTYNFNDDEVSYVKIDRTDNIFYISEKGLDIKPIVDYFINDIWKDGRSLNIRGGNLVKGCLDQAYCIEKSILFVLYENGVNVPQIIDYDDDKRELEMNRIDGIRIFELFVILDDLFSSGVIQAREIKKQIINKCLKHQKRIFEILNERINDCRPYPAGKINELITVLLRCVHIFYPDKSIRIDIEDLRAESLKFYEEYCNYTMSLFRDSTVKNMVIEIKGFTGLDHIDNIENYAKLKSKVFELIQKEGEACFDSCLIYDLDFASCVNTVNRYDDLIGLTMHERTYSAEIEEEILHGRFDGETFDNREFFFGLFVRYMRFGGRKLLYRLLNPKYYGIRFKYDDERFYFKKIVFFAEKILPEFKSEYPDIYELVKFFADADKIEPSVNIYEEYGKANKLPECGVEKNSPWLGTWNA